MIVRPFRGLILAQTQVSAFPLPPFEGPPFAMRLPLSVRESFLLFMLSLLPTRLLSQSVFSFLRPSVPWTLMPFAVNSRVARCSPVCCLLGPGTERVPASVRRLRFKVGPFPFPALISRLPTPSFPRRRTRILRLPANRPSFLPPFPVLLPTL